MGVRVKGQATIINNALSKVDGLLPKVEVTMFNGKVDWDKMS